jgi:uncharacterized membrane protein YqjE
MKTIIFAILVLSLFILMTVALWASYFLYHSNAMTGVTFGIIAGLYCVCIMAYVVRNH